MADTTDTSSTSSSAWVTYDRVVYADDTLAKHLKYDSITKISSLAINKILPVETPQVSIEGDLNVTGTVSGAKVLHAVWNDVVDTITVPKDTLIEPGYAYTLKGSLYLKTFEEGQASIGIVSDTYGVSLGKLDPEVKDGKLLPVAIGGYVLAHVDKEYSFGTPLMADKGGYLTGAPLEMKRDYPERILAIYWKDEPHEEWGGVKVNNRKWVKII